MESRDEFPYKDVVLSSFYWPIKYRELGPGGGGYEPDQRGTHEELLAHIEEGERATWPLLARVRDQTCVSRALYAAIGRFTSTDPQ